MGGGIETGDRGVETGQGENRKRRIETGEGESKHGREESKQGREEEKRGRGESEKKGRGNRKRGARGIETGEGGIATGQGGISITLYFKRIAWGAFPACPHFVPRGDAPVCGCPSVGRPQREIARVPNSSPLPDNSI